MPGGSEVWTFPALSAGREWGTARDHSTEAICDSAPSFGIPESCCGGLDFGQGRRIFIPDLSQVLVLEWVGMGYISNRVRLSLVLHGPL